MVRAVVLTGGIGSGKSAVGEILAGWGARVVDADELAREVVANGSPGLAAVVQEFGTEVLAPDGSLDRSVMADVVFGRPERLTALEAIVHPLVERLAADRLAAATNAEVLVYEVPLPDRVPPFPADATAASTPVLVVVDAADAIRIERLRERGLSDRQIAARMASQPSREEWLEGATHVLRNDGSLDALREQVAELWAELTGAPPVSAPG